MSCSLDFSLCVYTNALADLNLLGWPDDGLRHFVFDVLIEHDLVNFCLTFMCRIEF